MAIKDCIFGLEVVVLYSDDEVMPTTVLECLAIGTLLIAHNTSGLTDLLKDCPGHLVKEHKPEYYPDQLIELFTNTQDKIVCPNNFSTKYRAKSITD